MVRDVRTLFLMIVLPVFIYPVVGFLLIPQSSAMLRKALRLQQIEPLVVLHEVPSEIETYLQAAAENLKLRFVMNVSLDELLARLETSQVHAVLSGAEYPARPLRIYYRSTDVISRLARQRLESLLRDYRDTLARQLLKESGLPAAIYDALAPISQDIIPPKKQFVRGLAMLLTLLFFFILLTTTYHLALDLQVGERERRLSELLRTLPVSSLLAVHARCVAVSLLAWGVLGLNLGSLYLVFRFVTSSIQLPIPSIPLTLGSMAGFLGASFPLVYFTTAIFLLTAGFSKSFREAQTYLVPVLLVLLLPPQIAILWQVLEIPVPRFLEYLPVVSNTQAMYALLAGGSPWFLLWYSAGLHFLLGSGILYLAAFFWKNEEVLYGVARTTSPSQPGEQVLTPWEAIALFLVAMFVFMMSQARFARYGVAAALIIPELIVLGGIWLAVSLWKRTPPHRLVGFRQMPLRNWVAALFFAGGALFLTHGMSQIVLQLWEVDLEFQQVLLRLVRSLQFPLALFSFAVLPGIFEEVWFRGILFGSVARAWGVRFGIVFSALLFGFAHLDAPIRIFQTFLLGLFLAYFVVRLRSLWGSVFAHFFINATSVVLAFLVPDLFENTQEPVGFPAIFLLLGLGLFCWLIGEWLAARGTSAR